MVLDALSWLVGDWSDDWREGEPGLATGGGESWQFRLGGRILVRESWCEYPATATEPAFRHDDLLVVFVGADGRTRADFWDSHGHVIRYATASIDEDAGGFTFESDRALSGPGQRLHYHADGPTRFAAGFELRLPGADSFVPYLRWRSSRR